MNMSCVCNHIHYQKLFNSDVAVLGLRTPIPIPIRTHLHLPTTPFPLRTSTGLSTNSKSKGLLHAGAKAAYTDSFQPQGFTASRAPPPFVNQPGQAGKVYVSHAIFKGKAALILQPRGPEFAAMDSGGIKLSKEGVVFVSFVPAISPRQYDWNKKQVFALAVVEIGTLLSLGPNESCEFFHDPSMGKNEEGNVRKVLKVIPTQDKEGHSFILNVSNNALNADDNFYVPVTKGEFAVMRSAFNFILPHLMGWDAIVDSAKPDASSFSVW